MIDKEKNIEFVSGEKEKRQESSVTSRNHLTKKKMAEQLMAMGLSKESVARILHLRL